MTKILVVDDNASSRRAVLTLLRHEGYEVAEAGDGADGLRVACLERPQLVISDILMPSMDGYEFVRRLRAHPKLSSTAVIFYTANYHHREANNLAEQCGVARVLTKPSGGTEFLRAVSEALAGVSTPEAAPIGEEFDRQHLQVLTDTLSGKADQLAALNSRFAALTELNVQIASERDPSALVQQVCAGARSLLGAKYAVLAIADDGDSGTMRVWSSGIDPGSGGAGAHVMIGSGLPERAFQRGEAVRMRSTSGSLELGLPSRFSPATSVLVAPISSLKRIYGWLCLADKLGSDEFDADDENMLTTLGSQVGRIYEIGSLYQALQRHASRLLLEIEERERATLELRDSEERFRQLAENIEDVFFITNAELSESTYVSPAYQTIWGRTRAQLAAHPYVWIQAVHPDDRDHVLRSHALAAGRWPALAETEFRIQRPDGQIRWISERLFPIVDEAGRVTRVVGTAADISERKKTEARIVQLSRVHAMLSGINSLIVRVSDRDELLQQACRLAIEEGKFRAALCAMIDAATGRLRLMAYQAKPPEAAAAINSIMATAAGDAGLEALHGTTVYNDLERDGSSFAMRHELLAQGIRGLAIFPLIVSGEPAGCLILMTEESGLFDAAEMHLLVELAGDISFALDHIDKSEKLNYLAYYDSLTGLANRTLFAERLAIHAAAAARGNGRFALVLAAPERSEGFNDALGRTAGDELTRELAARFVRTVGDTHRIGRIGSDRFAAIILDPESDYAVESALEKWWREWPGRPFEVEGREVSISAKAGISLFPADGTDAETLLRHAQAALNKAKNSPARHVFYTANLGARLAERLTLENEIRRAIEYEELALHYHPKVEMRERRLVGVEALMRWRSPRLGVVTPRDFIPIMEETGLIVEAGAWALRQACIDRSRWLERRLAAPRIAVNVSAIQLRHDGFVRTFTDVLRRAGAEPGIDVEVTESLLLEDVEENIKKLSQIRELGVHIALDDFGTGYSSLSYLAKLPVATLKIDRSFVLGMVDDPGATALVSTIISLARSLKLETVAEGVESEEQAKILRLLQCDQMQGYLISQPLPWDEMAVYLDGNGR